MVAPRSWLDGAATALRPPPKLTLSQWADLNFRLSAESAAEPGRWRTLPYQRGIMDAITDPAVQWVSVMKSARIGYTKCMNAAIAYHIHHDPCPMLVVQPTVEDAEGYSKEEIAPMLRDVPVLSGLVSDQSVKATASTILHKSFPGGVLSMVGANSGRGFRRVSRRVVIFDEVDGYPASAGAEGDPIALGTKRAEYYWNRKIIAGSTPLTSGASRIEELFLAGDQRRYYVPCPHCGHFDFLAFRARSDGRGHVMNWPDDQPELACFECSSCHLPIEETSKRAMIEAGDWRAEAEFSGHASFAIWSAYGLGPNTTWAQIATEFLEAKRLGTEKLKTFVNTVLGETWQERGEAPEWERLYQRREQYQIGTVPADVVVLTAGVDVQKDRLVYEVVGWAPNKESWSIEIGELHGDVALESGEPGSPWTQLDALLDRTFPGADDVQWPIAMTAVDSGAFTQHVYTWARRHPMSRVMAIKGVPGARMFVGAATPVDVTTRGKRIQRGYRMWPVGVDVGKAELYSWLRLEHRESDPPPGYMHFPEYPDEYFKQLTAEHLMTSVNRKTGRARLEWQQLPNRENHHLDARIYARAAAAVLGIDRLRPAQRTVPRPPAPTPVQDAQPATEQPTATSAPRSGYWARVRANARRPVGWLKPRR